MSENNSSEALEGFDSAEFEYEGKQRRVFSKGAGPAVIVMSEAPGITPEQIDFGNRLVNRGFRAVMPEIFGDTGRPLSPGYALATIAWACVSREFTTLALRRKSSITNWLRALARDVAAETGGGVGVVGMCLTGGFALAMMVDEEVMAPVLSQPSLPFAVTPAHARDLAISDEELEAVKKRIDDGACVLGFRFSNDRLAPSVRFERLREELGDGFIAVELDSSPGNPGGFGRTAHSVLTHEFVDEEGHPSRDAFERLISFLDERLRG